MKFMILIYGNEATWAALSDKEIDEIGQTHRKLQIELSNTRELLDHKELALENSKILRTSGGLPTIIDGPLKNGKEILGGYYMLDCAGTERATEIAAKFLEAEFAPIEIRRLSGDTTWDNGPPTL